ncbi:unnamed protein product [Rhizoctonia solani]|uniref:O-methylsterigmatocystin oxidoreductase n=1 Tax=Rhizoctonia solani TaxID=456999 RepID=A0A8H3A9P3_9AGAM|nr:unnamed protein product [Rhizoctonia solani]
MLDKHLLVGLTVATGLLAYMVFKDKREDQSTENNNHLPPSPKPEPVIGNLRSIPNGHEHLGFMELGKKLGTKMFSLSMFGTTLIVLNDREDAVNLFDKRSGIYSDRNCPRMIREPSLLAWKELGTLIPYGERWRKYRRLMNHWLNRPAVVAYRQPQEQATRKLLRRLLDSPKEIRSSRELDAEISLAVATILFRSLYGYEAESSTDPFLSRTQALFTHIGYAILSSNYLVNTIPALLYVPEWFPGAGWKREATKWRKEKETLINEIYHIGLENAKKDEGAQIMVGSLRQEALKLGLSEQLSDNYVKHILMTLVGAGRETTVNTLMMFLVAMVLFPEVQKKAQQELDSVIGNTRLPSFEDQAQLGYIERVIQETLRWNPVLPLVPHMILKDDTYKDYFMPGGGIVVANVWAMNYDETVYKDPQTFEPDRFLDPSVPPPPSFGWGRRRCPGAFFAEASLFIAISSILMTFDIGVAQDENGKDVLPSSKTTNTLVRAPEPFMLKLTPRSEIHAELIRNNT